MSLLEKQWLFAQLVARLISDLRLLGYEVTLGDAWRSPEEAARQARLGAGISQSLHGERLAIDLNLFRGGEVLKQAEEYRRAGELWESYSEKEAECCWGGRFQRVDAYHFSIAHGGRK